MITRPQFWFSAQELTVHLVFQQGEACLIGLWRRLSAPIKESWLLIRLRCVSALPTTSILEIIGNFPTHVSLALGARAPRLRVMRRTTRPQIHNRSEVKCMLRLNETVTGLDLAEMLRDEAGIFEGTSPAG